MFFDHSEKKICPHCGYIAYPPYPENCPKCSKSLNCDNDSIKNRNLKKKTRIKKQKHEKSENRDKSKEGISNFHQTLTDQKKRYHHKKKISAKKPIFTPQNDKSNNQQSLDFFTHLKMKSHPDLVLGKEEAYSPAYSPSYSPDNVQPMKISNSSVTYNNKKIKVKKKEKKVDLSRDMIYLGVHGEYFKIMGITTKNRKELFVSNPKFKYLLELASNLEFISTSILSGELDRMMLESISEDEEYLREFCFFKVQDEMIFVLYGNIPFKKAQWLLNQMRITVHEVLQQKNPEMLNKVEIYQIKKEFQRRLKYFIEEYIKLQNVFSTNKIQSLDNFLRVDYFGLSYESIGVLSSIITDKLEFEQLPPLDPNAENPEEALMEIKEAIITAKVEAIAANTVATTNLMPKWISVKQGFQHYKFIIFSKQQKYYFSLLVEGNLDLRQEILYGLFKILEEEINKPFYGDLSEYFEKLPHIKEYLKKQNDKTPH